MYRLFFFTLLFNSTLPAMLNAASEPAEQQAALAEIEQSCREEGTGEGLSGTALKQFVKGCSADLAEIQLDKQISLEQR